MALKRASSWVTAMNAPTEPLVTAAWLSKHLEDPAVLIVDGSYFVPGGVSPAHEQYLAGHLPGARFFDINAVADTAKTKEHAFPTAQIFSGKVGALGIGNHHHVVAYDYMGGACAAARVWFMFHAFGHQAVSVLNGGLTAWKANGYPLQSGSTAPITIQSFQIQATNPGVKNTEDMLANIAEQSFQVVDARSSGRFTGATPEPRPGLRSGHIPGAKNLPFLELFDPSNMALRNADELREVFAARGIDLAVPLTASCGSGVTACAIALGAYIAGKTDTQIYDGSWLEWGANETLPIESGSSPS